MVIYGASGHGKVIFDILESIDIKVDQVVDDNSEIDNFLGFQVDQEVNSEFVEIVIAIGNNKIRKKVSEKLSGRFSKALIHQTAHVSNSVEISEGTVVMARAVVHPSVKIGKHAIINTGSIVEHDVEIGDFAHISPGATVTGNVHIGEGSHIGAGATIIPGINIGKWATIGAGAVIINDVPDYAVVVGNPGKIIKFNKTENESR